MVEGAAVLRTPVQAQRERRRGALSRHGPRRVPGLAPDRGAWAPGPGLRIYVKHYNRHRPHRALGLEAPGPPLTLASLAKLTKMECTDMTCSVGSCTSTDELHERISASHEVLITLGVLHARIES